MSPTMDQITVTAYVTALATLARWTAGTADDWQAQLAIAGLRNAGFIKPDAQVTKQNWPLQVSRLEQKEAWAQAYADMWGSLQFALGPISQTAFFAYAPAAEQAQLAEAIQDAQKAITIAQVATGQGGGVAPPPPKKKPASGPIVAVGVVALLGGLAYFARRKAK